MALAVLDLTLAVLELTLTVLKLNLTVIGLTLPVIYVTLTVLDVTRTVLDLTLTAIALALTVLDLTLTVIDSGLTKKCIDSATVFILTILGRLNGTARIRLQSSHVLQSPVHIPPGCSVTLSATSNSTLTMDQAVNAFQVYGSLTLLAVRLSGATLERGLSSRSLIVVNPGGRLTALHTAFQGG